LDHDDVSIGLYCAILSIIEKQISGLPLFTLWILDP